MITSDFPNVPVRYAFSVQLGKMLQPKATSPSTVAVKYVKARNVTELGIDARDLDSMYASRADIEKYGVKKGDLLICEGGDVGRSAIVEQDFDEPTIFQNSVHRVRPFGSNDVKYLKYALDLLRASGYFDALCNRATIAHLTGDKLGSLEIPLPEPDEQRAIADTLADERLAMLEALAKYDTLANLLSERKISVITRGVTQGVASASLAEKRPSKNRFLQSVPATWQVVPLSKVSTKITNGYVGPTRDILTTAGVPYLQSLHIKDGNIVFEDPYYVTEQWSKRHAKSILNLGDVLIVQTGSIGEVADVDERFVGANCHALIIVSPDTRVLRGKFLAYCLRSHYGQEFLASVQTGALHPHLNCGKVKYFDVPLPSLEEQDQIISLIEREVAEMNRIIRATGDAKALVEERFMAAVSSCVQGKYGASNLVCA